MKLNFDELGFGALVALAWIYYIKILIILAIPICALLWAMGGSEDAPKFLGLGSRYWRRIGVPTLLCGSAAYSLHSIVPLFCWLPLFGFCSLGYGVPDGTDEGSAIGRFVYYKLNVIDQKECNFVIKMLLGIIFVIITAILVKYSLVGLLYCFGIMTLVAPIYVTTMDGSIDV